MNVLHIITGLEDGGAEGALFRLVSYGKNIDSHIVISLTGEGKYAKALRDSGIEVFSLDFKKKFIYSSYKLISLIRENKPDIVQTWMYHADLIGGTYARIFSDAKVFWGIRHSNSSIESKSTFILAKVASILSKFIPDHIISCANSAAKYHKKIGYECEKFSVIPNGYDFSILKPSLGESDLYYQLSRFKQDKDLIIGCVARWNEQKDHPTLFRALSDIVSEVPMKCILVGNGCVEDNIDLIELISSNGLEKNVILLGQRIDISSLMTSFDILILPSSHGEAFPNVLVEAMACKTPCIASDVGDAREIIGSNGWIFSPKNSRELTSHILTAYNYKENNNLDALGESSRNYVHQKYGINRMYTAFHSLWKIYAS